VIGKLVLVVLALSTGALVAAIDALPAYVSPEHRSVLRGWLEFHPEFRLALDSDCDCAESIETTRKGQGGVWQPQPTFHPFYVTGDFNSDGKEDFAVVLLKGTQKFVAIFNGGQKQPGYLTRIDNSTALFFGPPRPAPYRLVMGAFFSEGVVLQPVGSGYALH